MTHVNRSSARNRDCALSNSTAHRSVQPPIIFWTALTAMRPVIGASSMPKMRPATTKP